LLGIKTVNGCPLYTFTSIPCPFCGMGSLFKEIMRGDFSHLFYHNPMGIFFYFLFGAAIGFIAFLSLTKRKIVFTPKGRKLVWIPVVFFIIMWILNIFSGHHL
jgi:hypothetical protein